MKYFVIMAMGLTLTACQSTMPNDVILAEYNYPQEEVLQPGETELVSSSTQTEVITSHKKNVEIDWTWQELEEKEDCEELAKDIEV